MKFIRIFLCGSIVAAGACGVSDPAPIDTTGGPIDSSQPKGGAFTIDVDSVEISGPGQGRLPISIADTTKPTITSTGPFSAWLEVTGSDQTHIHKTVLIVDASAAGSGYVKLQNDRGLDSVKIVATQVSFKQLAVSWGFACGIGADDRAWCWGGNTSKQLGTDIVAPCIGGGCQYGNGGDALFPLPVTGARKFTSISIAGAVCSGSGIIGVCGTACAKTAQEEVYCWGAGVGKMPALFSPTQSLANIGVSSDGSSRCGLNAQGEAYCFTSTSTTRIGGPLTFTSLAIASSHSCGVSSGDVYCWGTNSLGALGIGSRDDAAHTSPEKAVSSVKFVSVSASDRSTCALSTDYRLYCWGAGFSATGEGATDSCGDQFTPRYCVATPRLVTGSGTYQSLSLTSSEFTSVAAVCGLTTTGSVDCWKAYNTAPSTVQSPPLTQIGIGGFVPYAGMTIYPFSCGLTAANAMYCWRDDFVATKKTD